MAQDRESTSKSAAFRKAPTPKKKSLKRASQPASEIDDSPEVGPALRALRSQLGLSLEELANVTGVSRAMLGQIELGQSVPTIKTLWRIAKALDLPFSALLGANPATGKAQVIRSSDAKVLTSGAGKFSSRALFPFDAPRRVEFYELRLKKNGSEEAEPHAPGTNEHLVVAQGQVEISVAGNSYQLGEGDAILFDADRPHRYLNIGRGDAQMFLIMTYAQPVG